MNEPVRVGINFPRSGQQLFVNVPHDLAATLTTIRAGLHTQRVESPRIANDRPADVRDYRPRTP